MESDSPDEERTRIIGGPVSVTDEESTHVITDSAEDPADPVNPPADPAVFDPAPFGPAVVDVAQSGIAQAPAASRNLLALFGVILAIPVWPVGLVLSALGLFKALTRRTGKVMAVIGLVLSVVTGGALYAVLVSATSIVEASPALDPGCAGIEGDLKSEVATLKADVATLVSNEDSAVSSSSSIDTLNGDLGALQGDISTAGDTATHSAVKNDLDSMNEQVQAVAGALTAVKGHSTKSNGAAAAALTRLQSADTDLDTLCATY